MFQLSDVEDAERGGDRRPMDADDCSEEEEEDDVWGPVMQGAHSSMLGAVSTATRAAYERECDKFRRFRANCGEGAALPKYAPLLCASNLVRLVHAYCALQEATGCTLRLKMIRRALNQEFTRTGVVETPFKHPVMVDTFKGWFKEYDVTRAGVRQRDPLPVSAVRFCFENPKGVPVPGGPQNWDFSTCSFRDVVMLSMGLRAMMRPSEVVNVKWKHIEFASPFSGKSSTGACAESLPWIKIHLSIDIVGTKTTQRMVIIEPVSGEFCVVKMIMRLALVACGADRREMLTFALKSSALWETLSCRLRHSQKHDSPVMAPFQGSKMHLQPATVSHVVKAAVSTAGLVGKYTGYSLRIGGACAVAASGGGLEVLRSIGGWSSDAVFTYMRAYVPAANGVSAKMGFGGPTGQA